MRKSNWLQEAKKNLGSFKPRCACWRWCPGKLIGCSPTSAKAAGVVNSACIPLDQAGLNDVPASQDRDKSIGALVGHVAANGDKSKAESIAEVQSCRTRWQ